MKPSSLLGILAAVIIAAAAYVFISNSQTVTEINGYVGGEKIGLLEDEEVQDILRDRYRLVIDYARRVPSIWSPTTPRGGISYSPPIRRLWNCISRFMETR